MRNKERLARMWEQFVTEGSINEELNELVRESWLRSQAYRVDPYQPMGPVSLSESELIILRDTKKSYSRLHYH